MASMFHLRPDNVTTSPGSLPGLISDATHWGLMTVVLGPDLTAGVFATGTNIVTIIIYFKMGFADATNISLMALAFSDLGIALTTITLCLGFILPPDLGVSLQNYF